MEILWEGIAWFWGHLVRTWELLPALVQLIPSWVLAVIGLGVCAIFVFLVADRQKVPKYSDVRKRSVSDLRLEVILHLDQNLYNIAPVYRPRKRKKGV